MRPIVAALLAAGAARCGGAATARRPALSGDWQLWANPDDANATLDWDTKDKHSANASARVTVNVAPGAADNYDVDLYHAGFSLADGADYTFTFWAKASSPRAIGLNSRKDGPDWRHYGLDAVEDIGTAWAQYSVVFTATGTDADGRISFWLGAAKGTVWVDDVALVMHTPAPPPTPAPPTPPPPPTPPHHTFTFSATADVGNPLVGFARYSPDAEPLPAPARTAAGARDDAARPRALCAGAGTGVPHSLENFYVPMRNLMRGPADFTFDATLEKNLTAVAARGHAAIFRVYLDYPGKTKEEGDAVPDFLIPGLHFYKYGGGVSPDWENATLIDAVVALIGAMGARYDADPRIAVVQVGFLGHWGEWHDENPVPWASAAVQARVLRAFNASFSVTQVQARYPDVLGGIPASSLRIGFHDDSFAQDTTISDSWGFVSRTERAGATEQWRRASIGGEFRPELQACFFDDADPAKACSGSSGVKPDGAFAADVAATHTSHQWDNKCDAYTGAALTRAVAASASMGYKFFLATAAVAGAAAPAVSAEVENRGVAPFYYPVALRARCGSADVELVPAAGGVALGALMPGGSQQMSAALPAPAPWCMIYLSSRWAPRGARFAIAEPQPNFGDVPFAVNVSAAV